jgi:hypothetical protein
MSFLIYDLLALTSADAYIQTAPLRGAQGKLKTDTRLPKAGPAGGGPELPGAPSASAIPPARRLRVSPPCRLPPLIVVTRALLMACTKWYVLAADMVWGFGF